MNEKELNQFGKFIYNYFYGERLDIPISINNRLKRTHAWFVSDCNSPYIEVSKHLVQQNIFIISDVLAHELTHYYLFKNNKPYDDQDLEFYALTYKNGISRTNTASLIDGIMQYEYHQHISKCDCGFEIESYFPVIDNNFRPILVCPKCHKNMKYNFVESKYVEYIPSFKVEMLCDSYLRKLKQ